MLIKTLADALAAMSYLQSRGRICDQCGLELVTHANQFNRRCEGCLPAHGSFSKVKETQNVFERSLSEGVREWFHAESLPGIPEE